jgi:hypothetical protein
VNYNALLFSSEWVELIVHVEKNFAIPELRVNQVENTQTASFNTWTCTQFLTKPDTTVNSLRREATNLAQPRVRSSRALSVPGDWRTRSSKRLPTDGLVRQRTTKLRPAVYRLSESGHSCRAEHRENLSLNFNRIGPRVLRGRTKSTSRPLFRTSASLASVEELRAEFLHHEILPEVTRVLAS